MNKTLVVGGNISTCKRSKIVEKISDLMFASEYNGTLPNSLGGCHTLITKHRRLILKRIRVVSKVIGVNDRTRLDAVSRIFKFGANAVIAIDKSEPIMKFMLIDALNNVWCESTKIEEIINSIYDLYEWTRGSIRVASKSNTDIDEFLELNKEISSYVVESFGERYFGNLSTRCMKMFPSARTNDTILVSPRNIRKESITPSDMVMASLNDDGSVTYSGNVKPSVDTPIQLQVYKKYAHVNFIIHGHAILGGGFTTENYYPCGDLREFEEIDKMLSNGFMFFNLKKHGFMLCCESIHDVKYFIEIVKRWGVK